MDNLESFYEYQSGKANIYIKGRLKSSINFWQNIAVSDFILNVIKDGYKIPLLHQPQGIVLYNNKSAFDNNVFFDQAIIDLLRGGLIKEMSNRPHVESSVKHCFPRYPSRKKTRLVFESIWLRSVNS